MSLPIWHSMESDEVLQYLESSVTGLTSNEAQKRLAEYGLNAIPEKQKHSLLAMLLGQFADFMIMVLLVAALISGLVGEPQDAIAILVIVLLNAIIGAVQEFRAERAVAALREMAAPEAHGKMVSPPVSRPNWRCLKRRPKQVLTSSHWSRFIRVWP